MAASLATMSARLKSTSMIRLIDNLLLATSPSPRGPLPVYLPHFNFTIRIFVRSVPTCEAKK